MANIKHDHAVTQMALSNLDAWVNSPRVLSMIVCMVVYCVMQGVVDQGGFWVASHSASDIQQACDVVYEMTNGSLHLVNVM